MDWRKTREYREWRAAVIRRDSCCVICGSRNGRAAHHIANGAHHAELRFDVDNGVTLCSEHHTMLHTSYKHSYRQKTTEKDWLNFVEMLQRVKVLYESTGEIIKDRQC